MKLRNKSKKIGKVFGRIEIAIIYKIRLISVIGTNFPVKPQCLIDDIGPMKFVIL
jgi:hypothetical protein